MYLFMVLLLLSVTLFTTIVHGQNVGTIRLVISGSVSTTSTGIVQIYYNSAWGNICDDSSFGYSEANVICHQLGYSGVSTYGSVGSTLVVGTDTSPTLLEDVSCSTSNFLALLQCSTTARYSSECTLNSNDAYVSCYTTRIWSNPYSGQLRLVGGTYSNFGRLEVYCNSQWGTVCDDLFGLTDATVACRQLGYSRPYSYTGNLAGSNSQPIWLDNVPCTSAATSCIAYCQNCPSSQFHNCVHSEDVALGCDFGGTFTIPSTTTSTCENADSVTNLGAIIGGVIGGFILCIACVIIIPVCICCCLGIGVCNAANRSGGHRRVVTHTAANTSSHVTTTGYTTTPTVGSSYPITSYNEKDAPPYPTQQYPPAEPPAYPTAPAYPPPPPQQYPPAPAYPLQQYPPVDPPYPSPQADSSGYYPPPPPPYGYPPQS